MAIGHTEAGEGVGEGGGVASTENWVYVAPPPPLAPILCYVLAIFARVGFSHMATTKGMSDVPRGCLVNTHSFVGMSAGEFQGRI